MTDKNGQRLIMLENGYKVGYITFAFVRDASFIQGNLTLLPGSKTVV